ncbi:hypothetical protein AMECASPLE_006653 [Ameca splendens]|uniref:Uncharacterized protein n=1 Tax=Ameca splendens TaxID=208324 RepID=A0ABV0ZAH1_9TELE
MVRTRASELLLHALKYDRSMAVPGVGAATSGPHIQIHVHPSSRFSLHLGLYLTKQPWFLLQKTSSQMPLEPLITSCMLYDTSTVGGRVLRYKVVKAHDLGPFIF